MGQWLYGTEGREPTGLSVRAGGGRERFVFKCGLEVGGERWTEFAHHRARMTEKCV